MKLGFLVLIALVLLVPPAWADEAEDLIRQGEQMHNVTRDFPAAVALFQKALATGVQGETRDRALDRLAHAQVGANDFAGAIATLNLLIETGRNDDERGRAMFTLATVYFAKKDKIAGIAAYGRVADVYPKHPLAVQALELQAQFTITIEADPVKAVRIYERIALSYPDTDQAEWALGELPRLRKTTPAEQRRIRDASKE